MLVTFENSIKNSELFVPLTTLPSKTTFVIEGEIVDHGLTPFVSPNVPA
jgi:hypothetical protein